MCPNPGAGWLRDVVTQGCQRNVGGVPTGSRLFSGGSLGQS